MSLLRYPSGSSIAVAVTVNGLSHRPDTLIDSDRPFAGNVSKSSPTSPETAEGASNDSLQWTVIIASGGHFAATVFSIRGHGAPPGKQVPKGEALPYEILAHKTYHRYVVRYVGQPRCNACIWLSGEWMAPIRCEVLSSLQECGSSLCR